MRIMFLTRPCGSGFGSLLIPPLGILHLWSPIDFALLSDGQPAPGGDREALRGASTLA